MPWKCVVGGLFTLYLAVLCCAALYLVGLDWIVLCRDCEGVGCDVESVMG